MSVRRAPAASILLPLLASTRAALALKVDVNGSRGTQGQPAYWDDVLHYIDFEGSVSDAKGNGAITDHNGNCDTLGSYVEGVSGPASKGFHFDTTGWSGCVYKLEPDSGATATEWSVSLWFKPDVTVGPGSPRLDFLYGDTHVGFGCYTCYHLTMNRGNNPDLKAYHGGPSIPSPTFAAGTWSNVFISQGPSSAKIYRDGALESTLSVAPTANAVGDGIRILVSSGGGTMDELVFYKRSFSDAEVASLASVPAAATPAPTAVPAPGASAVGDPHLQNVHGERFDLMKEGKHVLISIPRGKSADKGLLRVQADARRLGGRCADIYFQEVNVTGAWAEAKQAGGYRYTASQTDVETPQWVAFDKVQLKVVHGRTDSGLLYLNVYVKHLGRAGFAVGGLLGEDDHGDAIVPPESCDKRMALMEGDLAAPSARSVALASLA